MRLVDVSSIDPGRKNWLYLAIVAWLAMSAWEIYGWIVKGNLVGLAYIPFFLALIVWRTAFRYQIAIEPGTISVYMKGLGQVREWQAKTQEARMLMPVRKRMLLKELGVSNFSHMYCSLDSNPLRVLLLLREGKKNPHALLFKASDSFYEKLGQELKRQNPDVILRTVENTR